MYATIWDAVGSQLASSELTVWLYRCWPAAHEKIIVDVVIAGELAGMDGAGNVRAATNSVRDAGDVVRRQCGCWIWLTEFGIKIEGLLAVSLHFPIQRDPQSGESLGRLSCSHEKHLASGRKISLSQSTIPLRISPQGYTGPTSNPG